MLKLAKRAYWRLVHPWMQRLGGIPTPADKIKLLARYGGGTLVETGTYLGDTTAGIVPHFQRIYTIELEPTLAARARMRFNDQPSVTVIEGDSATELQKLLPSLNGRTVFWLDAHNCGDNTATGELPLVTELRTIIERGQPDVILIDDAHHMGDQPTRFQRWIRRRFLRFGPPWPGTPTIDQIREVVSSRVRSFQVERDIIRIELG